MYFFIRSVLELSFSWNALCNQQIFCMMGVLKFLLYFVCSLKKYVILSCFVRGPVCLFSNLSLVFLLVCSFYNHWRAQCSKTPSVECCLLTGYFRLQMLLPSTFFLWQNGSIWNSLFQRNKYVILFFYVALILPTFVAE